MRRTVSILLTLGLLTWGALLLGEAYAMGDFPGGGGTYPPEGDTPSPTRHEVIDIWYTRNAIGMLTDQSGDIVADGVDIDGNEYHSETALTYDVLNGKALLENSYSETHSWNEDGSESWSQRNTYYDYDENGVLTGASGDAYTHGYGKDRDDGSRGNYYDSNSEQTYTIIEGEAQVVSSEAETYTYVDDTKEENIGYSDSTTTYDYEVILGAARLETATTDTYSEDRQNYDPEGDPGTRMEHTVVTYENNDVGSVTGASGEGTAAGTELTADGWMAYTSDITIEFDVFNGVARETHRQEVKDSTPLVDAGGGYGPGFTLDMEPIFDIGGSYDFSGLAGLGAALQRAIDAGDIHLVQDDSGNYHFESGPGP